MKKTFSVVGNFIKTLIMPRRMRQYRSMNIFLSVLIFFALAYIVTAPDILRLNHEYTTNAPVLLDRVKGLRPLLNNTDTNVIEDFPANCAIKDNYLDCDISTTFTRFVLTYDTTEGTVTTANKVTIVFDLEAPADRKFNVARYHTESVSKENENYLLFVFTRRYLEFYPKKDKDFTYENDPGIILEYSDHPENQPAITDITTKTTSESLTKFLAAYVDPATTDKDDLKPLTANTSTEALDSLPTTVALSEAGTLTCEFSYKYTEVPFSFTTDEESSDNPVINNVLIVFDIFDPAKRSVSRFDFIGYNTEYPTKTNERDYLFVLQPRSMIYYGEKDPLAGTSEQAIDINRIVYYSVAEVKFTNMPNNNKGLTEYLGQTLITNQVVTEKQNINLVSFITTVLLPVLIVFVIYLLFHRSGVLKKFKEYYDICAISFIPTSFVFFILNIFFGYANVFPIFFMVQILFYIFCVFRINVDFNELRKTVPAQASAGAAKAALAIDAHFETIPEENHRSQDMMSSNAVATKKNK